MTNRMTDLLRVQEEGGHVPLGLVWVLLYRRESEKKGMRSLAHHGIFQRAQPSR